MNQSNSLRKNKSLNKHLNKENHLNRGVELMLNSKRSKKSKPIHITFNKMICLLNREFKIHFEFSFNFKKI